MTSTRPPAKTRHDACPAIARQLASDIDALRFTTPSHVYNPLRYMWDAHRQYLSHAGDRPGRVLLLGMNPGPWGMAQTGVPFGEIHMARDWLGIRATPVPPLPEQHPKYPILGYDTTRHEGSGQRFWGWARERFGNPDAFFEQFMVWNYCPLLFIAGGRNLVPGKLRKEETVPLLAACNRALAALLDAIQPAAVVGIGRFAEERAREVAGQRVPVGYLLHPSPANPAASHDWAAVADATLAPWLGGAIPRPGG